MAGQEWDPQDWEWRPTWLTTSTQSQPLDSPLKSAVAQYKGLLQQYIKTLTDLQAPRQGLKLLYDPAMLNWYANSISHAVSMKPGANVLVLGSGSGGVLAAMAAQRGAGQVICIEQGPFSYRAAKAVLSTNSATLGNDASRGVQVIPCDITHCWGPGNASGGKLSFGDKISGPANTGDQPPAPAQPASDGPAGKLYEVAVAGKVLILDVVNMRYVSYHLVALKSQKHQAHRPNHGCRHGFACIRCQTARAKSACSTMNPKYHALSCIFHTDGCHLTGIT